MTKPQVTSLSEVALVQTSPFNHRFSLLAVGRGECRRIPIGIITGTSEYYSRALTGRYIVCFVFPLRQTLALSTARSMK